MSQDSTIPELDVSTLGHIFAYFDDTDDVARCACVCTSWRAAINSEPLWESRLRQDFGAHVSPYGSSWPGPPPACLPFPFPRDAWVEWNNTFVGTEPGAISRRATVKRMTSVIKRLKSGLLAQGLDGAVSSFKAGIALSEIRALEESLRCKFPSALRVLWATCGGQEHLNLDTQSDITPAIFWGAFGGYGVYDMVQSMRLLDFDKVDALSFADRSGGTALVPIAASFNLHKKVFVDCTTGEVLISSGRMRAGKLATPSFGTTDFGVPLLDAPLLLWLENYVQMLEDGVIGAEHLFKHHHSAIGIDSSLGICLFPQKTPRPINGWPYHGPVGSEAITHGVRISARPLNIPEMDPGGGRLLFAYSIRMELLEGYALRECQLVRRHWIIRGDDGEIQDEVQGDGVVGEFPILVAGGEPFVYQSCTTSTEAGGSMEGTLEFVAGTLTNQRLQYLRAASFEQATRQNVAENADADGSDTGAETLKVLVAPFTFCRPGFLY